MDSILKSNLFRRATNACGTSCGVDYISGGDGLCAMVVNDATAKTIETYVVYSDHLGSIEVLTDLNGNIVAEQSFDAWGRYRDPNNWDYYSNNTVNNIPDWLWRGFTGHEHMEEFQLINMNGRLYDPYLGRMLSPDNYVQNPTSTQAYNRYTYTLNNPLKYTDPDGEVAHIIIGAAVGGVLNLAMNWDNIDNFWEGAAAFGIGAGAGALTAATGGATGGFFATTGAAVGGAILGGAATGATNNIIAQTGNSVGLNDVDWGQVGISSAVGGVSGLASYGAGTWASNNLANPLIGSLKIKGPMLSQGINGMIGGAAGGYIGGFTAGFLFSGGNINAGIEGAWSGLKTGAIVGAASGFAGGFVGGTGNAWNSGSSFGDGLVSGLQSGAYGAGTGGLIGGAVGGIQAHKSGLDFWKGDRIINESVFNETYGLSTACEDCGFQDGDLLSDFKADLSGSDDYRQLMKSYAKAKHYIQSGKNVEIGDLINL